MRGQVRAQMLMLAFLLLLLLHDAGLGATPGSLDQDCLLADALGYDGRQLAGHNRDVLTASKTLIDHIPSRALPVVRTAGAFTQRSTFPPLACEQIRQLVDQLQVMPVLRSPPSSTAPEVKLDSVDGLPEFQVDVLQNQPLVDLVWPFVEHWVVPSLAELYGLQLKQMRVAEMFVRRYDSGVAGARADHPAHSDASTVSVSVELSAPSDFDGGLFFRTGSRPANVAAQGSAVYHFGNTTHRVAVSSGTRWSLVLFFFSSCAAQLNYTSQVLPAPLQQRIRSPLTQKNHARWAGRDVDKPLKLEQSYTTCNVSKEIRTGIPRWLLAAAAEVGPAQYDKAGDVGNLGPLSCPPGTTWSTSTDTLLGRCMPCTAGMFSPRGSLVSPSTSDAPLVAAACHQCRAGFFSP
jgi:hypothetical protein